MDSTGTVSGIAGIVSGYRNSSRGYVLMFVN
jgi:hypothetical protein